MLIDLLVFGWRHRRQDTMMTPWLIYKLLTVNHHVYLFRSCSPSLPTVVNRFGIVVGFRSWPLWESLWGSLSYASHSYVPLTRSSAAARGWTTNPERSRPSYQRLNELLCGHSEILYIAMFNICMIYIIPSAVSTTQFNATSSSWYVVFFLLSTFIIRDLKWSKRLLWSAWLQFRQRQQRYSHSCRRIG